MKTFINNYNSLNFMKKILSLFFIMFLMFNSVNAIEIFDSVNNVEELQAIQDIDYTEITSYFSIVATNLTYQVEEAKNYRTTLDPMLHYTIFNNNNYITNFAYAVVYKDDNGDTFQLNRELNISGLSAEYITIAPDKDYEYISVYVKCDSNETTCGAGYEIKQALLVETPQDVNTIFTPLIAGVVSLIDINVSIWIIFYYLLIAIIVLGVIAGMIWGAKKWYDFTDEHKLWGKTKSKSNHK